MKKADKKEEVKTEVAKGKIIKNTENYSENQLFSHRNFIQIHS